MDGEAPGIAKAVSVMCRRAAASGFPLANNRIQSMAMAHAERMGYRDRAEGLGFIADSIRDAFEGWLAVEHHDIWEKMDYERAKEQTQPGTFMSDDMEALMSEMLASGL